ncbi:hypothetical protein [Corynebacterium simulans]|uniref:Uncharacterized protein n=1 Tax=Corynebacterium simulans TaxID=146827 RepID=A0ABR5V828_9CORY|nr:hypothetical protein [Corynebacterium simulans]KXU17596.1 hypothetical protein WM41_1869 [Corynebacterium simulans]
MTATKKKAPAGAGNTNEGNNETAAHSNKTNHSSRELRQTISKVQAAISDNNRILRKINEKAINASPTEFQELDAKFGEVQKANTVLTRQLRALVEECHAAAQREQRDARERQEESARHDARRREAITRITGHSDWSPIDLQYMLVERYREGGDYMAVLDAMKAVDDLDLQRAGLTSWGEGVDE